MTVTRVDTKRPSLYHIALCCACTIARVCAAQWGEGGGQMLVFPPPPPPHHGWRNWLGYHGAKGHARSYDASADAVTGHPRDNGTVACASHGLRRNKNKRRLRTMSHNWKQQTSKRWYSGAHWLHARRCVCCQIWKSVKVYLRVWSAPERLECEVLQYLFTFILWIW